MSPAKAGSASRAFKADRAEAAKRLTADLAKVGVVVGSGSADHPGLSRAEFERRTGWAVHQYASVLDAFVLAHAPEAFYEQAKRSVAGLSAHVTRTAGGATFKIRDTPRVEVTPTQAVIWIEAGTRSRSTRRIMQGEFFSSQTPWEELWKEYVGVAPQPAPRAKPKTKPEPRAGTAQGRAKPEDRGRFEVGTVAINTITTADGATRDQAAALRTDSDRLRSDRTSATDVPVVVKLRGNGKKVRGEIVLLPERIAGSRGTAVELPFTFRRRGSQRFGAALRLRTPASSPVLALVIYDGTPTAAETFEAWTVALRAAADLHCRPLSTQEPAPLAQSARPRRPSGRTSSAPRAKSVATKSAAQRPHPEAWVPQPGSSSTLSAVRGHVMRCSGRASPEARRGAELRGITLPRTGLTWREPHLRGPGAHPNVHVEFQWKPPAGLWSPSA